MNNPKPIEYSIMFKFQYKKQYLKIVRTKEIVYKF